MPSRSAAAQGTAAPPSSRAEAPHLVAALEAHLAIVVSPFAHLAGPRRVDHPVPHSRHAADDRGTHQHQHERTEGRIEAAHHAFVARKQARHRGRRRRVHRKQITRHMNHAREASRARHVDAVVILRAQVQRRKVAVRKSCCLFRIAAEQGIRRVAVSFGREDVGACDGTELADCAIHRAQQIGRCQRPHAGLEFAREELVEGRVVRYVGIGRLAHVDAVALDEPTDHRGCCRAAPGCRSAPHQHRQRTFGQQVLRQHGKAV